MPSGIQELMPYLRQVGISLAMLDPSCKTGGSWQNIDSEVFPVVTAIPGKQDIGMVLGVGAY